MHTVYYTQRKDGRFYECEAVAGSALARLTGKNIVYMTLEELPQEHGDKILVLLAAGADAGLKIYGVGSVTKSKQVYTRIEDDDIDIENVTHFELYFGEETNDTSRRAEQRCDARQAPFI